jgi:hypothetical protein
MNTSCCTQSQACSTDTTCLGCVNNPGVTNCFANAAYYALGLCQLTNCSAACGGGAGTGGSAGAGGAGTGGSGGSNGTISSGGPCDGTIALADTDPANGARALGLCRTATASGTGDGVISAAWVRADGTTMSVSNQMGFFDQFGPNVLPLEGGRVLALSSGRARRPNDAGACGSMTCMGTGAGAAPPGFPMDPGPGCSGVTISSNIADDVGLELHLRAPLNAVGFSFDSAYYSFEYPEQVCAGFEDEYVALVNPTPNGSISGNVVFQSGAYPISPSTSLLTVCSGCPDGTSKLQGTGFDVWDSAGATPWLRTTVPVGGGNEFTIRFAIWDSGDQTFDSTVLIDNFQWLSGAALTVGTSVQP